MNISARELGRPWAGMLFLGMTSLIIIGLVIEGLLIGPSLFEATRWGRAVHGGLGAVLFLLTLLLPLAANAARLPGRVIRLSVALFGLALLEVASAALGRTTPFFAALHPANALLMAGLTAVLLTQTLPPIRESRGAINARQSQHTGLS